MQLLKTNLVLHLLSQAIHLFLCGMEKSFKYISMQSRLICRGNLTAIFIIIFTMTNCSCLHKAYAYTHLIVLGIPEP